MLVNWLPTVRQRQRAVRRAVVNQLPGTNDHHGLTVLDTLLRRLNEEENGE